MQHDLASAMSNDNSPGPSSLNTPLPSTHHLKPCPNPDLWEYNSEELVRFVPMRKLSGSTIDIIVTLYIYGSTNTSAVGPISRSIHRRRKVTRIKLGVTIATSRSPGNTLLFLGTLNGITRIN